MDRGIGQFSTKNQLRLLPDKTLRTTKSKDIAFSTHTSNIEKPMSCRFGTSRKSESDVGTASRYELMNVLVFAGGEMRRYAIFLFPAY